MDNRKFESGAAANAPAAPGAPSSGYPTNGDPLASVPPTVPGEWWFHQIGEELRAILTAAGITPNHNTLNQLLTALRSAGVFQTPAQFDSTTKAATTASVMRERGSYAGFVSIGSPRSLSVNDIGKAIYLSGNTLTVPTPLSIGVPAGCAFTCISPSVDTSVAAAAGCDFIYGSAVPKTTLNIRGGQAITMFAISDTTWWVSLSTAELKYNADFAFSLGASGYQKLPSGLILQWGTWTGSATPGNPVAVTFPLAFPTACDIVLPTAINASTTNSAAWYDTPATTGFNGRCAVASLANRYIAIGR